MKNSLLVILSVILTISRVSGQCPAVYDIRINGVTEGSICAPDGVELSVRGAQLPSGGAINWFYSTNPAFDPRLGQGVPFSVSNLPVIPDPGQEPTKCPDLLMLFINSCNGSGSEPDNEFFVLNSGSGFLADDLQFEFDPANTFPGGQDNSINTGTNPCTIRQPDPALITSLRNGACNASVLKPAGPGTVIPPDAIVIFFTSSTVTIDYDFESICETGREVYIMQSACRRTVGAFTNAASCTQSNRFRVQKLSLKNTPCSEQLNYDRCNMLNLDGEYVVDVGQPFSTTANGGIGFNANSPCSSPPYDAFAKPDTIIYVPFDLDSATGPLCGQTIYFKAQVTPANVSCGATVAATATLQIVCPDLSVSNFTDSVCSGQPLQIQLSGAIGANYSWTLSGAASVNGVAPGSSTQPVINQTPVLTGGNPVTIRYTIRAEADGCSSAPIEVPIVVLPAVSAAISGSAQFCAGGSTTLSVNAPGASVRWSDGSTSASITVSNAGTYFVITDNGACRDSAGIVVTEVPQLSPVISGDTVLCPGGQTILSAASGFSSYSWSTGAQTSQIIVNQAGIYSVTVTQGSCSGTASIEVKAAPEVSVVSLEAKNTSCFGANDGSATVNLSSQVAVTVLWNTGFVGQQLQNVTSGTYTYTLQYSGCSVQGSIFVGEGAPLAALIDSDNIGCDGSLGQIVVNNVLNNQYSLTYTLGSLPPQSNGVFTGLGAGTYAVNIRNTAGCSFDSTINITQPQPILADFDLSPAGCASDDEGAILIKNIRNAVGVVTFSLDGGTTQNDPEFSGLSAGTYTMALVDQSGCRLDTSFSIRPSVQVNVLLPDTIFVNAGVPVQLQPQMTGLQPPVSYTWTPAENLSCNNCEQPVANVLQDAVYILTVINGDGCQSTDTVFLSVLPVLRAYVPDAFTPNGDGLNDRLYLLSENAGLQVDLFAVFNRWGEKVFEVQNVPGMNAQFGWDGQAGGNNAPADAYIYVAQWSWPDGSTGMKSGVVLLIR